jgi:hypothetical protein
LQFPADAFKLFQGFLPGGRTQKMTFQLLFQPGDRQFRSVDFFCGICRFPFKFPDIVMNSPQGLTARIEAEQQLFQFEFCVPVEALACLWPSDDRIANTACARINNIMLSTVRAVDASTWTTRQSPFCAIISPATCPALGWAKAPCSCCGTKDRSVSYHRQLVLCLLGE